MASCNTLSAITGDATNTLGKLRDVEKIGQLRVKTLLSLPCPRSSSPEDGELGVRQLMASEVFQSCLSQCKILELSKDTRALKEAFEAGDLPAVAAKLQSTLHSLENVRLDVGMRTPTRPARAWWK